MRILISGLLFTVWLPASVRAADREFSNVVDSISAHFQTRPIHIPMFGLVNMVAFVARPAGTKHIDLAVFENLDSWDRDGRNLSESIRTAVGGAWKPFVQARSSRSGEVVFVYMRPEGNDWRLLLVTVERHEAVVVQLQLNPDALQRWIVSPGDSVLSHISHQTHSSGRSRDLDP
ncbi:MAG TPA: hypothetical protein VNX18_12185 [Bryobacteraceae bacterium]|nr:hypothetical protein [Bryobacteraceae bacterium]